MADKEYQVRKGLIVANTVLVTNGSNVGINTSNPNVSSQLTAYNLQIENVNVGLTTGLEVGGLTFNTASPSANNVLVVNPNNTTQMILNSYLLLP